MRLPEEKTLAYSPALSVTSIVHYHFDFIPLVDDHLFTLHIWSARPDFNVNNFSIVFYFQKVNSLLYIPDETCLNNLILVITTCALIHFDLVVEFFAIIRLQLIFSIWIHLQYAMKVFSHLKLLELSTTKHSDLFMSTKQYRKI